MLALEGIAKSFDAAGRHVEVLRGLSLAAEAGDMLSIMGGSGSGKTTFMNIVGLLDRPSAGSYRIRGQDVLAATPDALAGLRNRLIGFVFQSLFLMPRLNIWRNVALPLMYRGEAVSTARRAAEAMLARVGLADCAALMPAQLSGGMRQRVAIARALVGEPAVLLADEPTGALDPATAAEIMALFHSLNRELEVLAIIITHDPLIAAQCRRQLVLQAGRLEDRC
jgi:putative ABC transport system ATP-binding protein